MCALPVLGLCLISRLLVFMYPVYRHGDNRVCWVASKSQVSYPLYQSRGHDKVGVVAKAMATKAMATLLRWIRLARRLTCLLVLHLTVWSLQQQR